MFEQHLFHLLSQNYTSLNSCSEQLFFFFLKNNTSKTVSILGFVSCTVSAESSHRQRQRGASVSQWKWFVNKQPILEDRRILCFIWFSCSVSFTLRTDHFELQQSSFYYR